MYFDINKFKVYQANKLCEPVHNSILDMFLTRVKLEQLYPGITFMKENYNEKIKLDCNAFYVSSGTDYLDVVTLDKNKQNVIVDVNYPKLDKELESDFDGFNLDQALSILAVGNLHEILKSEYYIKEIFNKNKQVKKDAIISSNNFMEDQKAYLLAKKFADFERKLKIIFNNAHDYMKNNYYAGMV